MSAKSKDNRLIHLGTSGNPNTNFAVSGMGMRMAPRDSNQPQVAAVGLPPEVYHPDTSGFLPRLLKV